MSSMFNIIKASTQNIVDTTNKSQEITLTARIAGVRVKGSMAFFIIQSGLTTVQCILFKKTVGPELFALVTRVRMQSICRIEGNMSIPDKPITSTTFPFSEIHITKMDILSESEILPFQLADAEATLNVNFSLGEQMSTVGHTLLLNNPWLTHRTKFMQTVLRIKAAMCSGLRAYLESKDFMEIQTPKICEGSSEGGADCFNFKYFDKEACLAQSPQLFKQMMVNSGFDRVFEIGPVFRAENANTNRHLCEFTGVDLEMVLEPNETFYKIIEYGWEMLNTVFNKIKLMEMFLALNIEPPIIPNLPIVLTYSQGIDLLKNKGFEQDAHLDISTQNEFELGVIVKDLYQSDLFVLTHYPQSVRPFYTMPTSPDPTSGSNSFDFILRGKEICSGAQRQHNYEQLLAEVVARNINPETLKFYLESFRYGSYTHGGCGFGLERLVAFFLNIPSIKFASAYPRDPNRLTP